MAAISSASISSRKLAKSIAQFACDMKAENIVLLDMREQVNFCDYFLIMSGNSERQVGAIADHIQEELDKLGAWHTITNGLHRTNWAVIDAGDVVTHIFHKEAREFYNLEGLWQSAQEIKWN